MTAITERLRQEFRVRDWWPGMDSFDSARGETVPHPVADEAAREIEALRAVVAAIFEDDDGTLLAEVGSASVLFPFTDEQNAAIRRALENGSDST